MFLTFSNPHNNSVFIPICSADDAGRNWVVLFFYESGRPAELFPIPSDIVFNAHGGYEVELDFVLLSIEGAWPTVKHELRHRIASALDHAFASDDVSVPYKREFVAILRSIPLPMTSQQIITDFVVNRAAKKIQHAWHMASCNPAFSICRQRLEREFALLTFSLAT
jgi:hypothetical protein